MKACITVHTYDGGVYAVLTSLEGRCPVLAESNLHTTWAQCVVEMKRYARERGINVAWTDTKINQYARS